MRRAAIALTVVALVGLAANLAVAAPPHSGGHGHAAVAMGGHHGPGPGYYGRGPSHYGHGPADYGRQRGYGHGSSFYYGPVPRYRVVAPYPYYYPPTYYGYPYYGCPGGVFQYRGHGVGLSIGF